MYSFKQGHGKYKQVANLSSVTPSQSNKLTVHYVSFIDHNHAGLLYSTLGNIDPKFRSTLHTIQLVAVLRTSLITKYGIGEILKPFVRSIQKLECVRLYSTHEDDLHYCMQQWLL